MPSSRAEKLTRIPWGIGVAVGIGVFVGGTAVGVGVTVGTGELVGVGVAGCCTVTVTVFSTVPDGPVQERTKVDVCVSWVASVPDTAFVPVQPFEAVQEVVFVDVQVRVDVSPELIVRGLPVSVSVGA